MKPAPTTNGRPGCAGAGQQLPTCQASWGHCWWSFDLLPSMKSFEAPGPFEHFDLVAIRIGHEEESPDQFPGGREFDKLAGGKALCFETRMLSVEIVDRHSKVPVAVAQIVRLGAILVYGEFKLEIGFCVLTDRRA